MSSCTYKFKNASGEEVTITGQAEMKAFLADGGLEQLLPGKVLPWRGGSVAAPAESPKVEAKPTAIDDFGTKLEGARKDAQASMAKEWTDDEIASQPFSKVWPAADIDAIEDPFKAALMFAARAEVPAKPRVAYKVKAWVAKVKMFRDVVLRNIGNLGRDRALDEMSNRSGLSSFSSKVKMLEAIDRSQWKRIGTVSEYPDAYTFNADGTKTVTPMVVVEIDGKREKFEGSGSVLDVLDKINEKLGVAAEPKKMAFEVRGTGKLYFINKKGDKEYRKLKTFDTSKEAFAYIKDNYDDLVAAWEGVKDRDNVGKGDVRNETNRPRTGSDWRGNLSKARALQALINSAKADAKFVSDSFIRVSRLSHGDGDVNVPRPFGSSDWPSLPGGVNPKLHERLSYMAAVSIHLLRNLSEAESFGVELLGKGNVPLISAVQEAMLALGHDDKVLRSVVERIPVDVMDFLSREKISAESLFRDKSVLQSFFPVEGSVSIRAGVRDNPIVRLVREIARGGAEVVGADDTARIALEDDSALLTGQFNSGLEKSLFSHDVTPDEFDRTFSFKGVQFGNWVSQGAGGKDRQGLLNQAYDALMDLANIVGVPPKAISLNGSLGLAFGARGSGNASAHFEPGTLVINLTKTRGAGTLAHEWFHALDNYFSRQRGGEVKIGRGIGAQESYRTQNYITYRPEPMYIHKTQTSTPLTKAQIERYHEKAPQSGYYDPKNWQIDPSHPQGVRPEVERAFADLVEALDNSPMKARSAKNDKGADGYWSRIIERGARSFENYVIHKMRLKGYDNDYLANVRKVDDFARDKDRYPYLLDEEVAPVAEAFDNLFAEVKTKETEQGVALYEVDQNGDPSPEEAEAVQRGLQGKNPIEAAAWLAENAPPQYATIAAKVRDKLQDLSSNFGVNFGLSIVYPGAMAESELSVARGATIPVQQDGGVALRIVLNGAGMKGRVGTSYRTALHELAHAATMQSVQLGHKGFPQYAQAVRDLVDVANAINRHMGVRAKTSPAELTDFERSVLSGRSNLFDSIDEVLVWGMTSPDAQAYLESIPYKSKSLWTAFVAAVRKVLGLSESNDTALSEILRISEVLMKPLDVDGSAGFARLNSRYEIQQPHGGRVFRNPGGVDDATWTGEAVDEGTARSKALIASLRAKSEDLAVLRTDVLPDTLTIDGVDRPTKNSKGQPIHPTEEGIRNFWRWFGDSRVVDGEGRPLVVYHGTPENGLTEITPGYSEPGAWFTENYSYAAEYSKGPEGEIFETYLSMKNPLVVSFDYNNGELVPIANGEVLADPSKYDPDEMAPLSDNIAIVKYAQRKGHDGVIFPGGNFTEESAAYVSFDSTKIKSATGNTGAFDSANPDIRFRNDYPDTQAFREWFGNSKMTNKAGEPLLFMHGSPASFEAFDSSKLGMSSSHTSSGLGHFFTRDRATAEKYADGGNIYTGWLRIEKPYVMMLEEAQAFDDAAESAKRRAELQKQGYDGAVILDDEGKPWATVAFEPWQFKSTDNNGSFDEFDDRMRFRDDPSSMRDAPAVPRDQAEEFIRKFVAEYPGAPQIMLADSFYQLPEDIQSDALEQGSGPTRAKGALKNGKAYVVLNTHTSMADLEASVFHEVLGHAGIRKLLGPAFAQELNKMFIGLGGYSKLYQIMSKRGMGRQFEGYYDAVQRAREKNPEVWTEFLASSILTEEVFAHIAEQKNAKALRDRFKALVGMVRDWLRRNGFARLASLGESDIVFLLQRARSGLKNGSGVIRDGVTIGETVIVDAEGRPVAKKGSPDYEMLKAVSERMGLRETNGPTVFSFAGEASQTADRHALSTAQRRIELGENAETVRQETGWFKGVDGKWRYEINDADAKLTMGRDTAFEYIDTIGGATVGDLISHPALFSAYPEIANVKVSIGVGRGASFSTTKIDSRALTPEITIGRGVEEKDLLSVLLHEIQHGIQDVEGFARGGSLSRLSPINTSAKRIDEINHEINQLLNDNPDFGNLKREQNRDFSRIKQKYGRDTKRGRALSWDNVPDAERDAYFDRLDRLDEFEENSKYIDLEQERRRLTETPEIISPEQQYQRLAGEVEARNTQARLSMTDADRSATPPSATADVADSDVIVMFNGKEMQSAPRPENAPASSASSDDIPVFRTVTPEPVRTRLADLMDSLKGDSAKTFNWWQRTIGSQYGKAKSDRDFGRVYDAAHAFLDGVADFAKTASTLAPNILPHLDTLKDVAKGLDIKKQWSDSKDYQAVSSAIFEGTLANGTTGKVWSDAELQDRFNLNQQQIDLYREFRKSVDFSLDTLAASELARLARASQMDVADRDASLDDAFSFYLKQLNPRIKAARAAVEGMGGEIVARHIEERATLEEAAAYITEKQADLLRKEMQSRHDKEIAEVMGAERKLEELRASFTEKVEQIRKLQSEGYAPLMRFGQYTVDVVKLDANGKPEMGENGEPDRPFFGMFETESEARRAAKALSEDYPDHVVTQGVLSVDASQLYKGVTPETAEMFARMLGTDKDEAFQTYLKQAVANRSAMKRLINRLGIDGFSNDVPRVLASFITSNARLASGNWHFGEMAKAVEAIPKQKGDVKDEAIRLMQYVQNPQEEAAGLRGFLFFSFLGGSIASAMVNLTQTFSTTLPYLHQFGGAAVAKALPKAMALSGKMMTKGLSAVPDGELKDALKKASDEGVVDPQEIHLLMAESGGNGSSVGVSSLAGAINKQWATPAARVTRSLTQAWGMFFGAAEKYNRHVAFIAAWEVAPDGVDRYEFAKNAVTETQFDYTKASRPNWARGAVGATLFTFKTFMVNYVEFMSRLPPRERALALAVLFLMAGMSGMPGADDLDDVVDTVAQKMGYNWNNSAARHAWLAKTLTAGGADFVERGLSSLLPLDVSARLGMGNIVPGTGILMKSNDKPARDIQEFFGPIASVFAGGKEVFDDIGSGKGVLEMVRPIAPKAYGDLYQAVDMIQTGQYRDRAGRKVVDVSALDATLKAVGFQPNAVAGPRRIERMLAQSAAMHRAVRQDIHELMARGRYENDADKVAAARGMMKAWNEKNPEAPIRLNPTGVATRVRAMRQSSADRLVKATPKDMRGALSAELAVTP